MGERPLVAIGRKTMDWICDNMQVFGGLLFCNATSDHPGIGLVTPWGGGLSV